VASSAARSASGTHRHAISVPVGGSQSWISLGTINDAAVIAFLIEYVDERGPARQRRRAAESVLSGRVSHHRFSLSAAWNVELGVQRGMDRLAPLLVARERRSFWDSLVMAYLIGSEILRASRWRRAW
jgi:hypothetical protein